MKHILVVEDEVIIRSALRRLLERTGYKVSEAGSVDEALNLKAFPHVNLIITDLRLPGNKAGTDLINHAGNTPVLVMTSYASVKSAVESMKQGAVDYIAKPFNHEDLVTTVAEILNRDTQKRPGGKDNQPDLSDAGQQERFMYGRCPAMLETFQLIRRVAPTDTTVLIQGESGTGKELAAKAIHQNSPRKDQPLICVNCAAIPETLIESELFGHEKGAFTGAVSARNGLIEAANEGTLFLDEIGELPLEAQARLLRVLQEKEVRRVGATQSRQTNIRLLAATHRNLKALTQSGEFREDLFYRLNVVIVNLPPLRDRGDDILGLADLLLQQIAQKMGRSKARFSDKARQLIRAYSWPGNVRELENAIHRALILCEDEEIGVERMGIELESPPSDRSPPQSPKEQAGLDAHLSLEDYFQQFVLANEGKMSETELASKLGISRKNLWERRQRLGIPRKRTNS